MAHCVERDDIFISVSVCGVLQSMFDTVYNSRESIIDV